MPDDLTPKFKTVSASDEIVIPGLVSDNTNQPVGGFMATPSSLTQGSITLNGLGEQILVGAATAPLTGAGVFIGNAGDGTYDFRAGDPSGNYIHWDASAATLTINGAVTATSGTIGGFSIGSNYIKDAGDSFGLSSATGSTPNVRFWAGASFIGRATAPARINDDGSAIFKSVQIGGANLQYTMNDNGMYSFGDGSDGAMVLDGTNTYSGISKSGLNYTLTRDIYVTTLDIKNNVFLYTANFRIFVTDTLTLENGGQILNDGNAASGQTGGAATPAGTLPANIAGVNGGAGGGGSHSGGGGTGGNPGSDGNSGNNVANSIGANQGTVAGSRGGDGGGANTFSGGTHGSGGAGGTRTARVIPPVLPWHFQSFFDINTDGSLTRYNGPAGNGSGGGGGAGAAGSSNWTGGAGGNGGGSGASGGIIYIAARHLIINSGSNIFARGGKGGDGGAGGACTFIVNDGIQCGGGGGGGGGAGGQGGVLFLIYNTIVNSGTITLSGGQGGGGGAIGTAANGGGPGFVGSAGNAGADGIQISIQMAL